MNFYGNSSLASAHKLPVVETDASDIKHLSHVRFNDWNNPVWYLGKYANWWKIFCIFLDPV